MDYSQLLHGPFIEGKGYFKLFLDSIRDVLEAIRQEGEDYADEYSITTATTNGLNKWGIELDLPRKNGETDTSYRARLMDVYDGKGITKSDITNMVNGILNAAGYGDCTIYDWYADLDFDLDLYEFRIVLPQEMKFGFFEGMAFCGFQSAIERSFKEAWLVSVSNVLDDMDIDEIERVVNKFKGAGTHFRTTYGGRQV